MLSGRTARHSHHIHTKLPDRRTAEAAVPTCVVLMSEAVCEARCLTPYARSVIFRLLMT